MAKVEITINGKAYPCRQTMGAMLRFKRETGREVTTITNDDLSGLCTLLFCCVQSACKHDGVDFDMDLVDFADSIEPADLMAWASVINGEGGEDSGETDDEKKT